VVVVSSIRAADLDLTATQAPACCNLHQYLDYAERVRRAGTDAAAGQRPTRRRCWSGSMKEIRRLGFDAVRRVGCSGYRIDLGSEPRAPGTFCSASNVTARPTTRRDGPHRDRLRQQVLEQLRLAYPPVWAPDWLVPSQDEVERLRQRSASQRAWRL